MIAGTVLLNSRGRAMSEFSQLWNQKSNTSSVIHVSSETSSVSLVASAGSNSSGVVLRDSSSDLHVVEMSQHMLEKICN